MRNMNQTDYHVLAELLNYIHACRPFRYSKLSVVHVTLQRSAEQGTQ